MKKKIFQNIPLIMLDNFYHDKHPFKNYLIPIKIRAPLNFAPLIFAPSLFASPQILRLFNFRAPLFTVNVPFFHSFVALLLVLLILALLYCANLLRLIFAQARCAKNKGARILKGIRYLMTENETIYFFLAHY